MRHLLRLACLVLLALVGLPAPAHAFGVMHPRQPQPPPSATAGDGYERRIVTLVNVARADAALRSVAVSPCADSYADSWSTQMAATGSFTHRRALGTLLSRCQASSVAENIAYGNVTADEMMSLWMDSPGHRANILRPSFTHIGVGASRTAQGRVYGTQNFLRLN